MGMLFPTNRVHEFWNYDTDQAETVSRRVEKFAELMQSVWMSKNDYERRMRAVGHLFLSVCITAYSRIILAPISAIRNAN